MANHSPRADAQKAVRKARTCVQMAQACIDGLHAEGGAIIRARKSVRGRAVIDGKPHDLSQHRGKVVLVSNVASA